MKGNVRLKTLELVDRLLAEFRGEDIAYCHWKSTTNLTASLSGETDLDLLVSAEHRERCLALLDNLGFLQADDSLDLPLPGISHFFGFDRSSGHLVHVHLHFQLIVGDDLVKNYRLPVEGIFWASAKTVNGIAVPAPEVEFIIFVVRMTLKRRLSSILVRILFLLNHPSRSLKHLVGLAPLVLNRKAQAEFDDLSSRISEKELTRILCAHFPFISPDLFEKCRFSLLGKGHRLAWIGVGNRLSRALADYRRSSGLVAFGKMFLQAFRLRIRAVAARTGFPSEQRKSPLSGGRIIAFVGGDGAGKTTMVKNTAQWLGRYFSVRTLHLGKPNKGPLWFVLLALMRVRALFPGKTKDSFHKSVRYWLVSYYRNRAFCRAVRLRRRGMVVLLDRVPLPDSRYMDSPRIACVAENRGGVIRCMAAMEEKWHRHIKADDLIVLRLDPEIAAERRPDDDQELLAKRSGEIWSKNWQVYNVHVVDASQPLEEVVKQVRSHVWGILARKNKVIELLGPAGSGKSTLAEELRRRFYNFHAVLGWRDGKSLFLTTIIKRLPYLIPGMLQGVPLSHLKIAISTETILKMLSPQYRRHYVHGLPAFLEVGPAFLLAFLEKESARFDRRWLKELRMLLKKSIDHFVWLDASDDLLMARINGRSKRHRIKHVSEGDAKRFLGDYRQCLRELVGSELPDAPVTTIDTERLSVAECADIVARIGQYSL